MMMNGGWFMALLDRHYDLPMEKLGSSNLGLQAARCADAPAFLPLTRRLAGLITLWKRSEEQQGTPSQKFISKGRLLGGHVWSCDYKRGKRRVYWLCELLDSSPNGTGKMHFSMIRW